MPRRRTLSPDHISEARQISQRYARQFVNSGFDRGDLIQEGVLAALQANANFDRTRGTSWSGFVGKRIKGAIYRATGRKNAIEAHHEQMAGEHGCPGPQTDQIAHYARVMEVVHQAWADLPEPIRWVWHARVVREVRIIHIAEILGWRLQWIVAAEQEGNRRIREWMEQRGFTHEVCRW